jgi:exosortase K
MKENKYIKISYMTAVVILLFIMKLLYLNLSVDDYFWLLFPVKTMVSFITDIHFWYDPSIGYTSYNGQIIINDRCSGLNFFIITLFLSVFIDLEDDSLLYKRLLKIIFFVFICFILTVFSNSIRISICIYLAVFEKYFQFLKEAKSWVHEGMGTFVFLFFLLSYNFLLMKGKLWIQKLKILKV